MTAQRKPPAGWHEVRISGDGIDWEAWLGLDKMPIDPYLLWADQTGFAGFSLQDGQPITDLPIAVEVDQHGLEVPSGRPLPPDLPSNCPPEFGFLDIPGAYKALVEPDDPRTTLVTRFFTASLPRAHVNELMRCAVHIKRFQLGVPRIPRVAPAAVSLTIGAGGGLAPDRVVVGVIDDGFAFAHPEFLNAAGEPRTCFLWDQDRDRRIHDEGPRLTPDGRWPRTRDFGYGGELIWQDLAAAVRDAGDDERKPYVRTGYLPHRPEPDRHATSLDPVDCRPIPPGTMLSRTHGTSVLHLCAGRTARLGCSSPGAAATLPDARGEFAAAWPLVLVQLPSRTTLDTSGGSLAVHILDGLRYIVRRAEAIRPDFPPRGQSLGQLDFNEFRVDPDNPPRPGQEGDTAFPDNRVVVNLSYGAIAGPHDGTSIVERAIQALAGGLAPERAGTWVVLAAGNAHQSRTHVRLDIQGGQSKSIVWTVGPDNLLESYLEIWLPDVDRESGGSPSRHVASCWRVRIRPPGGLPVHELGAGQAPMLFDGAGQCPVAGAVYAHRVVQGERGTMVLIAVARTQRPLAGSGACEVPIGPHGDWAIEVGIPPAVRALAGRHFVVHAWAERNDQLWGNVRRQQSTVVGDDPVPEPTEFFPSVLESCRHGPARDPETTPRPFLPDLTLGSLSSVPAAQHALDHTDTPLQAKGGDGRIVPGGVVVVGGWRTWDDEVPAYSASGPVRTSRADRSAAAGVACGPLDRAPEPGERFGPDFSAPSDQGSALRGLPTGGTLSTRLARVSGTSAAAPLAARYLAGEAYSRALDEVKIDWSTLRPVQLVAEESRDPKGAQRVDDARLSDRERQDRFSRRSTPTPTRDDRFRLGNKRIRAVSAKRSCP